MSVSSEIERLTTAKENIAEAIEAKGVSVPSGTLLSGMSTLIDSISQEPESYLKTATVNGNSLTLTDQDDSTVVFTSPTYTLPAASADVKGGIKIGNRLTMTGETLSADIQTENNYTTSEKTKLAALSATGIIKNTDDYLELSSVEGVVSVQSINNKTGHVMLNATDVGAAATVHTHNAGNISYNSSETYTSETVGAKISSQSTDITSLQNTKVNIAAISTAIPSELVDNTIYNLSNVSTLDLSTAFPTTAFDCIINLTTAESGAITITFPTSLYIPSAPTFGDGETWTIWIRNNPLASGGIITAQKAVSGS